MTLHFLCPAPRQPAGGVEKIYQFVATLERAGVQAIVVHPNGSKPLAYWFEPAATVVRADQLDFDVDRDVLVVPERWAFDVRLPNDAQVIVLNQGAYLTFGRLPLPAAGTWLSSLLPGPFGHDGLLGVVCVSTDSERYLRFTFPELEVRRIHVGIDTSVFSPGDTWRDHALAYMPRRRPDEVGELLRILASRGRSPDWVLRPLEGLDHRRGRGHAPRRARLPELSDSGRLPAPTARSHGVRMHRHRVFGPRRRRVSASRLLLPGTGR